MAVFSIDFETRSTTDLKQEGIYRYADNPETRVLCMAWRKDKGPPQIWRSGVIWPHVADPFPQELLDHIATGGVILAHNAQFERLIWNRVLVNQVADLPELGPRRWYCTMAAAYAAGLPGALEDVAIAMGVQHRKDPVGSRAMLALCAPRNGLWRDSRELAEALYAYCKQDVEVERSVGLVLPLLSPAEREMWAYDQEMNDRGVRVDVARCERAMDVAAVASESLNAELSRLTGGAVEKNTQGERLKAWLRERGLSCDTLAKSAAEDLKAQTDDAEVLEVLDVRARANKTSTAKYKAFVRRTSADGRLRGILQFHGAATGRWSGRGVQLQNLPRIDWERHESDIRLMRSLLDGSMSAEVAYEGAKLTLDKDPLDALSLSLRTMLVAGEGRKLVGADYSNIEGRITAWLAGEAWLLQAFRDYDAGTGPDIYKVTYSKAFGVPVAEVAKPQRQIGKVMALFLGFQGGVGAFQTGAKTVGLKVTDERANELKVAYRQNHPEIVALWRTLEDGATLAVRKPGSPVVVCGGKIVFEATRNGNWLRVTLPSGRALHYRTPHFRDAETPFGVQRNKLHAWGKDGTTGKWSPYSLYGGILTENFAQAISACLLRGAIRRAFERDVPLVLSVHDEVVAELAADLPFGVPDMEALLVESESWAEGLPVAAEGWEEVYYGK